ncbi:MAG: FeoB-associated Cys-rich membrane protein [Rhodobacteraceae bacterium]|nr:FeoB-associated Cys-rich membrane protein [Paracoccaceae bacterium]
MTGMPAIDFSAETGIGLLEYGLIALALAAALAFLFRRLTRRRRGAAPACSGCGGCSGGGDSCKVVDFNRPAPAPEKPK